MRATVVLFIAIVLAIVVYRDVFTAKGREYSHRASWRLVVPVMAALLGVIAAIALSTSHLRLY